MYLLPARKNFFAFHFIQIIVVVVLVSLFFSFFKQVTAAVFGSPTPYSVNSSPKAVVAGDFNGDGKNELAVVNSATNDVTILLNVGGTFSTLATIPVGNSPSGIATADFNGDGKLDLAVTNSADNNVHILLGVGDGTFVHGTSYAFDTGTSPSAVKTGDMNDDGKVDLIVANAGSNNASMLFGDGAGGFSYKLDSVSGTRPYNDLVVADFGGLGYLDIALVSDSGGRVVILPNYRDGTFSGTTDFLVGANPKSISSGDFNSDGRTDLAVANYTDGTVTIFLGDPVDHLVRGSTYSVGANPRGITVGDFNNDGKVDIATANYSSNDVSFLAGNNDGTFAPADNYSSGSAPYAVVAANINGDIYTDLVVVNNISNNVSVLLNTPPGSLDHFAVVVNGSPAAGSPFTVSLTAKDSSNSTLTSFTGTVDLAVDSGVLTPVISGSFVAGVLSTQSMTVSNVGIHTLTVTDHAGSGKIGMSAPFDVSGPVTVANVTSSTPNASYKAGVVIPIQVIFSVPVSVTGTPVLNVVTNSPTSTAVSYSSGGGD